MDLSTKYLGIKLAHPFMPGASPLVDDLDMVRRLEDAGASAIVMHSLFEEQIANERAGVAHLATFESASAEATNFFPSLGEYRLGPDLYLEQIRKIKAAVKVPVFASLNGTTSEGWLHYAKLIEKAGADALELNVYHVATDPTETGRNVEERVLNVLAAIRKETKLPIAVKLSPFYSSVAQLAAELEKAGAKGLVLFNRFYQPDLDVEGLGVLPTLQLSDSSELLLRLRWLAIVSGRTELSLAASGGVHTPLDGLKAIMAGAHTVQIVSAILQHGPGKLTEIRDGVAKWLVEHEYESLEQAHGSLNLSRSPDPAAFERANYLKILAKWKA
jgi:dihydroorotate dehydrogenase (fumarate)